MFLPDKQSTEVAFKPHNGKNLKKVNFGDSGWGDFFYPSTPMNFFAPIDYRSLVPKALSAKPYSDRLKNLEFFNKIRIKVASMSFKDILVSVITSSLP